MNIAIFASAFYPSLGGVEELCRQLAMELMRQGHGVIVLTNRWPRDLPATETLDGIPIYRLPFRLPEGSAKAAINYHLTHSRIERDMLAILRAHKIDVLNIHCVSSNAHYAMIAQEKLNLPLVVTLHGELTMDANQVFQKSRQAQETLRSALRRADAITACSQRTLQDAESFFGETLGDRARVILNGIDLNEFNGAVPHRHSRPYLFALGRLVNAKGFDILLRAFATGIHATHDLFIAGEGAEKQALVALAVTLGVQDNAYFPGRLGRDDVVSYMAGCDFFVLPSRQEPLGIVNLEAMASGKAVLANRVGGVPEIVTDGENVLLVDAENIGQLVTGLGTLAKDIQLRTRLGAAGKERVVEFAWPTVARKYLGTYEVARRSVPPS